MRPKKLRRLTTSERSHSGNLIASLSGPVTGCSWQPHSLGAESVHAAAGLFAPTAVLALPRPLPDLKSRSFNVYRAQLKPNPVLYRKSFFLKPGTGLLK